MEQGIQVRLVCEDDALRNKFLVTLFKTYGVSNGHSEKQIMDEVSEIQSGQKVAKLSIKQLINWRIKINNFQFSFKFGTDHDQTQFPSVILLLQVACSVNYKTIKFFKKMKSQTLNLLIVIMTDKSSKNNSEQTLVSYKNQIKQMLKDLQIKIKQDFIRQFSLQEQLDINKCSLIEGFILFLNKSCYNQVFLKREAEIQILTLLKKFGIANPNKFLPKLMTGNDQSTLQQFPDRINIPFHQAFLICEKIKSYLQFLKMSSKIQNQDQQLLKKKAKQKLTIISNKYGVTNINEWILDLMEGDIQKSIIYVGESMQRQYLEEVRLCKELYDYLKFVGKDKKQEKIIKLGLKQNAIIELRNLLKKYGVKRIQYCINDLLQNNLKQAMSYINQQKHQQFKQQILQCKQYQAFINKKQSQYIKEENSNQQVLKKAKNAVEKILSQHDMQLSLQQALQRIFNNELEDVISKVPQKFQQVLRQEFVKCLDLQKYLLENYPKQMQIDYKQEAQKSLKIICQKFNAKFIDKCVIQLLNRDRQNAQLNINRDHRQLFLAKIDQCKEYQTFLHVQKDQNSEDIQDLRKQAQESLKNILKKYRAKQIDKCLRYIFQGNSTKVKQKVISNHRQKIQRQIQCCPQYIKYKNQINSEDQSITIINQAKRSLRKILSEYTNDVNYCIELILSNKPQSAYLQIQTDDQPKLIQKLNNSKEYQIYLKKAGETGKGKIQTTVKLILSNNNINKTLHNKIKENILNGKYNQLKKYTSLKQYYCILSQLMQNAQFAEYFKENSQSFMGNISYFYYFINESIELQSIINMIILPDSSSDERINKDHWIQQYLRFQNLQKIEMIEKQLVEIKQIFQIIDDQKSSHLFSILQSTIKIVLINQDRQFQDKITFLLKQCDINITEVQEKLRETKEKLIISKKNQKLKLQKQKQKYSQIIMYQESRNQILQKMNSKNKFQCVIKFTMQLMQQNKTWKQISLILQKKKTIIKRVKLSNNNFRNYLMEKEIQLKEKVYICFYQLNKQLIDSSIVPIYFYETTKIIMLEQEVHGSLISKTLIRTLNKDFDEIFVQLVYKNGVKLLKNDDSIFRKPEKIIVSKKIQFNVKFRNNVHKILISKRISSKLLKIVIIEQLTKLKIIIEPEYISLFGFWGQPLNSEEITDQIQILQIKNNIQLKYILVRQRVSVIVYYQINQYKYTLQSDKTVNDIKKLLLETTKIPIKSQGLLYANGDKQQEVFSSTLENINEKQSRLVFTLISKINLQHYGFHQNYNLNFQDYTQFFIEKQNEMQNLIDTCNFKKKDERIFFQQLIKFLYSAIKRRFPLTHITDQLKKKFTNKKQQQIWSGGDFNEHFLIYYMLNNSDLKLKIQLMNILRTRVPLPLYFRKFKNITVAKNQWVRNQQIIWLMHPGLCITSIGLHTENFKEEKGKTYLNNILFSSNFQESQSKHPISHGCPQILMKALGNIVPVNIIDIPYSTNEETIQNILKVTNVLIIHSWKSKQQSQAQLNEIKKKFKIKYVICILRDSKSKQGIILKVKKANFKESPFVQLYNIQKVELSFLKILKDKIWNYIIIAKQQIDYQNNNIYRLFNYPLFMEFQKLLSKLKGRFYQMKIVFDKYQQIKNLNKRQSDKILQSQQLALKEYIKKKKISSQFEQVLLFVKQNIHLSEILMLRLRQVLKQIKNQEQRKYYIINTYKKQISRFQNIKELPIVKRQQLQKQKIQYQRLVNKAIIQIEALPKIIKIQKKSTPTKMVEELAKTLDYFECHVKSKFFTIQAAWRQIQYLTTLHPEVKLGQSDMIDFLIDTKRKDIANSQPFELLDGDLLEMPKNIIQKVFIGIEDKVVVISIIGPQSSGKSTLLNFLFGCDFGTSEGRCTKGVYGTYFKFSNNIQSNCNGVLLIDTQGLFATINKQEETKRKDFDPKLVLFCLSVSDFVIINTKGNLDSGTSKILKSSMDRFEVLTEQNIQWPQIFLILNQNNSANTSTSEADINKMREFIKFQSYFSLNQAYTIQEYNKDQIQMLPQDQSLVKKQSRKQFLNETNRVQHSLMTKIKSKDNFKSISAVIDLMERSWSTIEAFPDLGKSESKNLKRIYGLMKDWKKNKIIFLSNKRQNIFNRFKNSQIQEIKCQQLFQSQIQSLNIEFKSTFLSEKYKSQLTADQISKIEAECNKNDSTFSAQKYQLDSQIKERDKNIMAQKCKLQGGQHEKEAIRKVNNIQRNTKKTLSDKEKEKYFEEAFNNTLQAIRHIYAPKQLIQNYFSKIFQFYDHAYRVTANQRYFGLPQVEWQKSTKMNFCELSRQIKNKILISLGKESTKYIEYRNNAPTKILDPSTHTDAKLQYFNMRNYYKTKTSPIYYEISTYHLQQCLKMEYLREQLIYLQTKQHNNSQIEVIFKKINRLLAVHGFKFADIDQFEKNFKFQCYSYIRLSFFRPRLKISILPHLQQRLKKCLNFSEGQFLDKSTKSRQKQISTSKYNKRDPSPKYIQNQMQIASQRDIYEAQKFVNIERLKQIVKNMNSLNVTQIKHIQDALQQIIQWEVINTEIKYSKEHLVVKNRLNNQMNMILNRDLEQLGIQIQCSDYYQYILYNNKQQKIKFKRRKAIKNYRKQHDIFSCLKKLKRFDQNIMQRNLKKNDYQSLLNYVVCLGSYNQQKFQVKPEYKYIKQLQKYISNEEKVVISSLNNEIMRKFVYNEIFRTKSIENLFTNIDNIISKSSGQLSYEIITKIFIDVNRQIIQFNNDLNQISHKLTALFVGYIHHYAIYLKWKQYSETALKEANKPYEEMLKAKSGRLHLFILQTSNDDNIKSEVESNILLNEVKAHLKQIIQENKSIVNKNESILFKQKNSRDKIQKIIDKQSFGLNSSPEKCIDYLINPAKIINEEYQNLTALSVQNLSGQYKKCQKATNLLKQFKQLIQLLLKNLQSNKLNEDTRHSDIFKFSIKGQSANKINIYQEQFLDIYKPVAMRYFLDLLIKNQKQEYFEGNITFIIKSQCAKINIIRDKTKDLQSLIHRLIKHKMSITRLYTFVQKISSKLQEKEVINQLFTNKFQNEIQNLMIVSSEDQKKFRSLVTVIICKQLCPCCRRICGVDTPHTNRHQCLYGHQMRALGGVKLQNNDASVMRCQDVPLFSSIKFNGRQMTWKSFKEQWEAKEDGGSWIFQDLKNNNKKQLFMQAWDIAGRQICKKYNMNFVQSNFVKKQTLQMKPIHYIFALDDSGSMQGDKWNSLMKSFAAAIQQMKNILDFQIRVKMSILVFNDQCIIFQQNITPKEVNLDIPFRSGMTSFTNAFSKAYDLMKKYIAISEIKFIFMTDGGADYPLEQVNQIIALKDQNLNKIQYIGIEFQENVQVMKLICKELKGTNKISYNEAELTAAYIQIINRQQLNSGN